MYSTCILVYINDVLIYSYILSQLLALHTSEIKEASISNEHMCFIYMRLAVWRSNLFFGNNEVQTSRHFHIIAYLHKPTYSRAHIIYSVYHYNTNEPEVTHIHHILYTHSVHTHNKHIYLFIQKSIEVLVTCRQANVCLPIYILCACVCAAVREY